MTLLDRIASKFGFEESGFSDGEDRWSAELLYKAAKDQKARPERLPLKHIDFSESPFKGGRLCDYIWHTRRIESADTSIPIIIGPLGGILDGYHRIAKALLNGDQSILCYRLKDLPKPDGKE